MLKRRAARLYRQSKDSLAGRYTSLGVLERLYARSAAMMDPDLMVALEDEHAPTGSVAARMMIAHLNASGADFAEACAQKIIAVPDVESLCWELLNHGFPTLRTIATFGMVCSAVAPTHPLAGDGYRSVTGVWPAPAATLGADGKASASIAFLDERPSAFHAVLVGLEAPLELWTSAVVRKIGRQSVQIHMADERLVDHTGMMRPALLLARA
jgi:hypothetical protein